MRQLTGDKYEILEQIGRGSYATVYRAINRQTRETCAIKKIPVTSELSSLVNEIKIMEECNCENIVRLLTSNFSDDSVSIVMEYCCGGSVKDVMRRLDRTMAQEHITVILRDVLKGLDYLHSKNKIHRDIKAANILLNGEGVAKLGDFGVSEQLDRSKQNRSIIGTLLWLPPEVINQHPDYSTAIDIWSLGITIIEMGDGQPPFSDLERSAALDEIANLSKPAPRFRDCTKWSPELLGFLDLCLSKSSQSRASAHELLEHVIFRDAPTHGLIRELVSQVCPSNQKNVEKVEVLLRDTQTLFNTYKERRMKVIRVDQKTDSLEAMEKEFEKLVNHRFQRDSNVERLFAQLKVLEAELTRLERDRNNLRITLEGCEERKRNLREQLAMVTELRIQTRVDGPALRGLRE